MNVRLSEKEKARFEAVAQALDLPLSVMLRFSREARGRSTWADATGGPLMATAKEIDREAVRVFATALKTGQPKILETGSGAYSIESFRGKFFWQLPRPVRRAFRAVAERLLEFRKMEKRT